MGNETCETHNGKRIWIISEEKPRADVILYILKRLKSENHVHFHYKLPENCSGEVCDNVRIRPEIKDGRFMFKYTVEIKVGSEWKALPVYIMLGKGSSNSGGTGSFVDYLVYVSKEKPDPSDVPIYAIETTKTDFTESRNTSVYQRGTKFVFIDLYYPPKDGAPEKILYYHDQNISNDQTVPETYKFGIRMYKTLDVHIEPKDVCEFIEKTDTEPFRELNDLVASKNAFKAKTNPLDIPIEMKIVTTNNEKRVVLISAKLSKKDKKGNYKFTHDPNIGLVSLIGALVHKISNGNVPVIVVLHGLKKKMIQSNKLVMVAARYNIHLADERYNFPEREKFVRKRNPKNGNPYTYNKKKVKQILEKHLHPDVRERIWELVDTGKVKNGKELMKEVKKALMQLVEADLRDKGLSGVIMKKFEEQKKQVSFNCNYWNYDTTSEKNASILFHTIVDVLFQEKLSNVKVVFHNHSGSELSYLITPEGKLVSITKEDTQEKKKGKTKRIPDLIVADHKEKILWVIEGKARNNNGKSNLIKGIEQLVSNKTNKFISEDVYPNGYSKYKIKRGIVFFDPNHSLDKTLEWINRTLKREMKDKKFQNKVNNLDFIFVLSKEKNSNEGEIGVLALKRELPEFIKMFKEITGELKVEHVEKDYQKRLFE